jgi:hypothetical protein
MSRLLRTVVLAFFVASCGSGNYSAPRDLENACSIVAERPQYLRAMKRTERKWGVPVAVQMATIHQESKFIGNARTPHKFALGIIPMGRQSSAYGYSQALDGTWDEYKDGPGRWRAKPDDIGDATDFIGWYMNKTRTRNGIQLGDAYNQYLAYHEGHTGYARGSYHNKPWLKTVAGRVAVRAEYYQNQLRSCGRA